MAQRGVARVAQVVEVDVTFRTEHADTCPLERQGQVALLRIRVNIRRFDVARRGQCLAECLHRVVVERHGVRELGQLRAQGHIQPERLRHGAGGEAMKLVRVLRFRMMGIHRGAHPDRAKGDAIPELHAETRHVVLVLMGDHQ